MTMQCVRNKAVKTVNIWLHERKTEMEYNQINSSQQRSFMPEVSFSIAIQTCPCHHWFPPILSLLHNEVLSERYMCCPGLICTCCCSFLHSPFISFPPTHSPRHTGMKSLLHLFCTNIYTHSPWDCSFCCCVHALCDFRYGLPVLQLSWPGSKFSFYFHP